MIPRKIHFFRDLVKFKLLDVIAIFIQTPYPHQHGVIEE
jgi:hypothetical protein